MNLTDPIISYIVLSSDNIDDVVSVLYAKDYKVIPIQGYYQGNYENSAMAYSDIDNDELRKDLIFLLNHFNQDCGIIKYKEEIIAKKVFSDGSEKPLEIAVYNTDSENRSYLYNGISFSFIEQKRYWLPKKEQDFKTGMIVEYLNNNKWFSKKVENPKSEYEKMYKLLIKYDKIRVQSIL